jgi:hypothetical protein
MDTLAASVLGYFLLASRTPHRDHLRSQLVQGRQAHSCQVSGTEGTGDRNGGRESEAGKNRVHCGYTSLERFLFKGDVNPSTWVR